MLWSALLSAYAFAGPCAAASDGAQDYRLTGIFYRADGRSSALFELKDKSQRLVAQGRLLQPGVEVTRVQAHRVEISTGSQRKWLALEATRATQKAAASQPLRAPGNTAQPPITPTKDMAFRRRLLRLKAGLISTQNTGQQRGFRLQDTALLELLHGAQLREGDIIKAINGNGFSRAEDLEDFAYNWSPRAPYRYTILRGGETIER